uniref:Uncharacterized protein n=1 Tax=Rhizophora mucronata TaxID=61149 RepID=A0A2P2Q0C3_RHIMU
MDHWFQNKRKNVTSTFISNSTIHIHST